MEPAEKHQRSDEWLRANREAHLLATNLKMDHRALSDFACLEFGVASIADLTDRQIRRLPDLLRERGARKPRRPRLPNGERRRFREDAPNALPTDEQQLALASLFAEVDALVGQKIARSAFIIKVLKNGNRLWPQNRAEANKIIEGLKNWIRSLKKRQSKK